MVLTWVNGKAPKASADVPVRASVRATQFLPPPQCRADPLDRDQRMIQPALVNCPTQLWRFGCHLYLVCEVPFDTVA